MQAEDHRVINRTVPVTIIAGFLGAGKTSLLSRVLLENHGKKIAVLVNDFGKLNIDANSIVNVSGETVSLSNGCICCTIRDDLLREVMKLIAKPLDQKPEHILIETSGVSDPALVANTFSLAALDGLVDLYSIISVIDAEQVFNQPPNHTELVFRQIKVADIALINKVDLVSKEQLNRVRKLITEVAPKSRILESNHGQIPTKLLFDTQHSDFSPPGAAEESKTRPRSEQLQSDHEYQLSNSQSPTFETWLYASDRAFSLMAIRMLVEDMPTGIYRMKGFVRLETDSDERAQLQMTGGRAWLKLGAKWSKENSSTELIFIGMPGTFDHQSLNEFVTRHLEKNSPSQVNASGMRPRIRDLKALSVVYTPRDQQATGRVA